MNYSGNFSSGTPIIEGADAHGADALAFLLRLVGQGFPGEESAPRLIVGRLPDDWPGDVPLPDGARVVGSQVRGAVATIVLDVDRPAQQVLDDYSARLQADGWTTPEQPGRQGGFTFAQVAPPLTLCQGTRGPSLSMQATALEGGPTDVRLNLNTDPHQSPCAPRRHGGMRDLLPNLAPPRGARQLPQGGGGGSDSYYSNATLRTELDPASVAAHYTQHLRGAGWTRRSEGQSGPLAWSTWTFRDEDGEEWHGLLFVLHRPELAGQYMLYLRADLAAGDAPTGGWTSLSYSSRHS